MPKRAIAAAAVLAVGTTAAITWSTGANAQAPADRQGEFAAAAAEFGVPEPVLLGVSYMESRWRDHGGTYSTAAGFGPMHLTDAKAVKAEEGDGSHHDGEDARGDDRRPMEAPEGGSSEAPKEAAYATLPKAAELTGASREALRTDPLANIRGGAALLADHQDALGIDSDDPGDWYAAVAKYSGAADTATAGRFADDVFELIASGATEKTDDGTVKLKAAAVSPDRGSLEKAGLRDSRKGKTECPKKLKCEWIPAPYEKYGEKPVDYGNHDQANRPKDMDIDYLVIHDTETSYTNTLRLVQDPTYVSWQYTLRSFDGHVAQHVKSEDVAWQAGNWSVNAHSMGLEHEGVAAEGSWFTEAMYRSSAKLVKYLSKKFDIPLNRDHIIGHDNVPGTAPAKIAGMHWDTGPFWDWQHYFDLLGAPLEPGDGDNGVVMVAPDFDTNTPEMIGCDVSNPQGSCGKRGAAVVFLRSEPRADAPLLNDKGIKPDGTPATNRVNDVGSRAGTGQRFVVAEEKGDWTAVWYLGQKGWIHNPKDAPTLIPADGKAITPKSDDVKVYGVPYPEAEAYEGTGVPVQDLPPLPYTIDKGQSYSTPGKVDSEYYYAKEFEVPGILVEGDRSYYQIQLGGRLMYVDAADVKLVR
ncbi:N-acetylmuramoyl-L-alanine amidase [Stackebrandtia nassauensis]|uniref:N-acetylmuramoyl-L-alanine amidase n=1 Tax=Stackebrandtia nassauensis TaxID=283811 RepID=UPI0001A3A355|nr:N-acetylmuramoyl-L-alanine amidase [Stackebrandtia nassauensis]